MVAQLQLHSLVDLALCDPEVGAVNFKHLRTLLHCMLKLSNHANDTVGDCFIENIRSSSKIPQNISAEHDLSGHGFQSSGDNSNLNGVQPHDGDVNASHMFDDHSSNIHIVSESQSKSLNGNLQKLVIEEEGYTSETDSAIVDKSSSEELHTKEDKEMIDKNIYLKFLINNHNNLELRVSNLEKNINTIDEQFPANAEILVEHNSEDLMVGVDSSLNLFNEKYDHKIIDSPLKPKTSQLFQIWQNKKLLRRIEATEETIDKLFFLMNDLLGNNGGTSNAKMNNETDEKIINEKIDECVQKVDDCKSCLDDKIYILNDCVSKVNQLGIDLGEVKKNSLNIDDTITDNNNLNNSCKNMFNDLSLLVNKKADSSEVDKKVNIDDFQIKFDELVKGLSLLNDKFGNQDQSLDGDDTKLSQNDLHFLDERLQSYIDQSKSEFLKVHDDLSLIHQMIKESSPPPEDNPGGHMSIITGENVGISDLKDIIHDALIQIENNRDFQDGICLKIDDLVQGDENFNHSLEELRSIIPTIDTSVLASLQHLSQENRNQISSLHASLRLLKESQMIIPPTVVPENMSDKNLKLLDVFQNRLLVVQDEQIKQSSQVLNIISDYKEEFNRKQLHIDALYDYIDKLQKYKADKEEVTVEMDVKAYKQALDSKVNMSTFDERYQMLEHSLQQALDHIDQYAKEEEELKSEFTKLSDDMNSKMNSDTEKRLKKFLNSRLREIEDSQSQQYGEDFRNAAGMRKPMPLSFNCLSCDRPIDVKMRGVMPPIPNYMPSKNPLKKNEAGVVNDGSYYNVNRPCGGQHTSVNINMLRMIKLNPLTASTETNITKKTAVNDKELADCVVGKDGQIYRGRYKIDGSHYSLNDHERLKTRSAKNSRRKKSKPENRPRSAELIKNPKNSNYME